MRIEETNREAWCCQVNKETAEKYKQYFRENEIYFEPSEIGDKVYISITASDEEAAAFNEWAAKEFLDRKESC